MYPFDIETTGLDPYKNDILLIQLQRPSGDIYILNCRKLSRQSILDVLLGLWKGGEGTLLGQNLKFDLKFLLVKFPEIYFHKVKDTYITEQLIVNGLVFKPPSLAELANKYCNIEMSKEVRKSFVDHVGDSFTKDQLDYAATDLTYLIPIYTEQQKHLKAFHLEFVEDIESRTVPALAKMEVDGIFMSHDKWKQNENIARAKKCDVQNKMNEYALQTGMNENLFGEPKINWSAPLQLLAFLRTLVDPGIPDTGEKTISLYQHPFIDLLLEYREYDKLISSYGDSVLSQVSKITHRLHPSFNQLGAKTGRFSAKNPNVQQVPKTTVVDSDGIKHLIYREAFIPQLSTGYMVGADYSSFELRVLTDLTKEPEWIKGYEADLDMHATVGSFVFGVPVSKKVNPELRDIGKSLNFGIAYGLGATKLMNDMQLIFRQYGINKTVTVRDAGNILKRFFEAFGNIKTWQDVYVAQVFADKKMVNPYDGRVLFVEGKDWTNRKITSAITNESKNYPCQSTNASVMKIAFANLQKFIFDNKCKAKVVNVIHDKICCV